MRTYSLQPRKPERKVTKEDLEGLGLVVPYRQKLWFFPKASILEYWKHVWISPRGMLPEFFRCFSLEQRGKHPNPIFIQQKNKKSSLLPNVASRFLVMTASHRKS